MRIAYIAPSALPARSANSVHVALQCEGLGRAGAEVTLYCKRTVADASEFNAAMESAYGVDARLIRSMTYYSERTTADTLRIALMACRHLASRKQAPLVLSRNLYAAYLLAIVARRPLLFETHQLETGMRRYMQRALVTCPWVTTVVISQSLVTHLEEHHQLRMERVLVLHDAARDGLVKVDSRSRREQLRALVPAAEERWDAVCGYFGHLYVGRGIEVIEGMAAQRPNCLFLIYGGNDPDIQARRAVNKLHNLQYMGHVPHPVARQLMSLMDVLLMPYQQSVSIGVRGHDTARWMSPMKMFEYLAAGVPLISSDLPVLREVLKHKHNCMLAAAADVGQWLEALDQLVSDAALADAVGATAHQEYLAEYSWTRRGARLLAAAREL